MATASQVVQAADGSNQAVCGYFWVLALISPPDTLSIPPDSDKTPVKLKRETDDEGLATQAPGLLVGLFAKDVDSTLVFIASPSFPTRNEAQAWYDSPAVQDVRAFAQNAVLYTIQAG